MLLAVLIAVGFGIWIMDTRQLDPTNVQWLAAGDSAQHFLGWHFFRNDEWRFPLGANPHFGMEMGSSIVFTDSIPLLAIPLKLIQHWLPYYFQYEGWWMLFCYALQGVFGYLLVYRFSRHAGIALLGTVFFIIATVLQPRVMGHYALMAQWLLLAAIWLYVHPDWARQSTTWRCLLLVALLVHGYLFYMVFALWVAVLLRKGFDAQVGWRPIAREIIATVLTVVLVMWVVGWFMLPGTAATKGMSYGQWPANLNTFINPHWGSPFLRTADEPTGFETFAYLGFEVLCLLVIAFVLTVFGREGWQWLWRHRWLLLILLGLLLLAISHKVRWNQAVIFELPLPVKWHQRMEMFRASARLLWPAFYFLTLAAIIVTVRNWSPRVAGAVLTTALALQLYDLSGGYRGFDRHMKNDVSLHMASAKVPRSAFWSEAANGGYQAVVYVPVQHYPKQYEPVALWAADHGLSINTGYFGRFDLTASLARQPLLLTELTLGPLNPKTLYVIVEPALRSQVRLGADDTMCEVDGLWIVAPGWGQRCCLRQSP